MNFSDLKARARNELKLNEPDSIKDNDDLLNCGYIEISTTLKIVFSVSTFRGKKYFDIRTWIQNDNGEWTPTKKGVHLGFERFEEFQKAVETFSQIIGLDQ